MGIFVVEFETENAAFGRHSEGEFTTGTEREIARILKEIVVKIEGGKLCGLIHDHNGNSIGTFETNERKRRL
jgi:hypothetical protein